MVLEIRAKTDTNRDRSEWIGVLVQERRKDLGMTQPELATLVGISADILSRRETGRCAWRVWECVAIGQILWGDEWKLLR